VCVGMRVSDSVLGHQQLFQKSVLYDTWNVTMKAGRNVLGVQVGHGWYGSFAASCKAAKPTATECHAAAQGHSNPLKCLPYCWESPSTQGKLGQRAVILVLRGRNSSTVVVSDLSWRQGHGSVTSDDIYKGETQDLKVAKTLQGWDTVAFGSSANWAHAVDVVAPGGELVAAAYPHIAVAKNIPVQTPQSTVRLGPGSYLITFARNTAALIQMAVPPLRVPCNVSIVTHEQLNQSTGSGAGPFRPRRCFYSLLAQRRSLSQRNSAILDISICS
jgi:hypothetical protein